MKELSNIINLFVNSNISLNEYIDNLIRIDINNLDLFNSYLESFNSTSMMDEHMNALIILWLLKKDSFNIKDDTTNEYLLYINEITEEIEDDKTSIILCENNYLIAKIGECYFIINHNNHTSKIMLPDQLQNTTVYCFNCNDDMKLKEKITLPEFSFYAIIK